VALILVVCGRGDSDRITSQDNKARSTVSEKEGSLKPQKTVPVREDTEKERFVIEQVDISPPDPTTSSSITAEITVSGDDERKFEYKYVFWVNAEIVKEGADNQLSSRFFKKNDFVFVDLIASKNGKLLQRKRSNMVQILNTSPEIRGVDFPDIRGPGTYEITVSAFDNDNDPLTYELEGNNLDDLSIDAKSGVITYSMKERPPERLAFFVVVKDDSEGETKQEVFLTFRESDDTEE
jgi:hypothetical protein